MCDLTNQTETYPAADGALKQKSDEMKQISLVFSNSELFENFAVGLALRGHDLLLTSGQHYKKRTICYTTRLKLERNRSETMGGTGA